MKLNIRKFKGFIFQHKIPVLIVATALIIATGVIAYEKIFDKPIFVPQNLTLKQKPKETKVPAALTGLLVEPSVNSKRPLAVVIENSPEARPQSGYSKADVVYETLAEGGITRTLAIFQSQVATEIGPVRSARPYFVDWLSEVNAIFVHVGGSIDGLNYVASTKIPDLNQFNFGSYFWRSNERYAPHNVYTTTEKLYAAAKSAKYDTTVNNLSWYKFKQDLSETERPVTQTVTVNFSGPLFAASWKYDPKTNDYSRAVAGVMQKDKLTGEQVKAKNIVVLFQTVSYGLNSDGVQKVNIGTIGSGKGFLFQDGKPVKITWTKASRTDLTKITDETGAEVKLNPGQTWVEIPPVGANVTY